MTTPSAVIFGCAGETLSAEEAQFFTESQPFGFILFARNCKDPAQVKALVNALKATQKREEVFILIDQEGGRVARLRPPHWRAAPAAGALAQLHENHSENAVRLNARLIAEELASLGINTDCAPMADIYFEGYHEIVGDRAFGDTPEKVAKLARAMADGLKDGGVFPILKHIPGHGRARADSHLELPTVETTLEELERTDFAPFRALADLPFAMTAHILYTALDVETVATFSPQAIHYIRETIGFENLLMSDDLSMKALDGSMQSKVDRTLQAGCDLILHCNGEMAEMRAIMERTPKMPKERFALARGFWAGNKTTEFDKQAALATLGELLQATA